MKAGQKLWTREEFILTLNLYLKLPFGKLDARTSAVIELATLLGRTPGSISMRLNNFASVDPYHQKRGITGLDGGGKQVKPYWDEFMNNKEELLFESELILANKEHISIETKFTDVLKEIRFLKGKDKKREVKTRVNQNIFRKIVLANYDNKCTVTGIDISEFLVASHIIPWSNNEKERLNPENGICFSSLYNVAYDKGLIGITDKFKIILSTELYKKRGGSYFLTHFESLNGLKINLPHKYLPKKEFLEYHLDMIFRK